MNPDPPLYKTNKNNNDLPIEAQNNNDLPIEAQNNNDLPIEIVVQPSEARNNDNLPVLIEPIEEKNENQILYRKYVKVLL